jgi:hypothetical protein
MAELISSKDFREAAEAGKVSEPTIIGIKGGYVLEASVGQSRRQLSARSASGEYSRRVFPSLQSVAGFLQEKVGIYSYLVDAADYSPASPAPRYRHASERMREIHKTHAATRHAEN